MSSTVIAKNIQVGTSNTATNNFTWYQPSSPDGTVRLGVGNSGATTLDAVTVSNSGNVTLSGTTTLTNISYSGTLTGGTGVVNIGSGQVYKDAAGNVGIGVTPASFATVKALQLNTASTVMAFTDELDIAQNVYYNAGNKYITNAAASMYVQTGGQHLWYRAASGTAGNAISFSESARIDSSGNLLVGTTSNGGNERAIFAYADASNNGVGIRETTDASGTTFLSFRNSSSVLCGRVTRVGTTNAVNYNTSSDYRLKENIAPMTGALAKVALLKPCTYTWKSNGAPGQGFIAHELAEVVPDAVSGEKDAVDADGNIVPQGIDTSFLVATLTAAIQEQQALIESLTARIAALEAK